MVNLLLSMQNSGESSSSNSQAQVNAADPNEKELSTVAPEKRGLLENELCVPIESERKRVAALFVDFISKDPGPDNPVATVNATGKHSRTNRTSSKLGSRSEKKRRVMGIEDAAIALSKKSKNETFRTSQQEWQNFKSEERIDNELLNHNRGKHGFIGRMGFLDRADLRTFEAEKCARNIERSKRMQR